MLKKFLDDTLKYGLGNIAVKCFSIIAISIIARNFPVEALGEISIVIAFVGLFTGIAVLGLDAAVQYYYFHGEEKLKQDYLGTAFVARTLMATVFFSFLFVFARNLSGTTFLLQDQGKYLLIILGAVLIPIDNYFSFFTDLTRFLFKPLLFNIVNIFKIVIYLSLILIFLSKGITLEQIFVSKIISSVIPSVFLMVYYRRNLNFKINVYCLKKMIRYGLPLIPLTIMYWMLNSTSRFFLNVFLGLEYTGIYSMVVVIGGAFLLITGPVATAWSPYAMKIAKMDNAPQVFARVFHYLVLLLIPVAFFFWSVSDFAILILATPIFLQGGTIIIFIVLQHILSLLYQYCGIGLTLTGKTGYFTIGYFISGIVTILISIFLCKHFGIFGAALSVFIGYLLMTIYIFIKSQQFYPIPYRKKFLSIYASLTLLVIFCFLLLPDTNIIINFITRFLVGCLFLFVPFIIKTISINELKQIFIMKKTV